MTERGRRSLAAWNRISPLRRQSRAEGQISCKNLQWTRILRTPDRFPTLERFGVSPNPTPSLTKTDDPVTRLGLSSRSRRRTRCRAPNHLE
jgi:hypothetical protein